MRFLKIQRMYVRTADMLRKLRKSNELENGGLSIDESARERFCEEFRSAQT